MSIGFSIISEKMVFIILSITGIIVFLSSQNKSIMLLLWDHFEQNYCCIMQGIYYIYRMFRIVCTFLYLSRVPQRYKVQYQGRQQQYQSTRWRAEGGKSKNRSPWNVWMTVTLKWKHEYGIIFCLSLLMSISGKVHECLISYLLLFNK